MTPSDYTPQAIACLMLIATACIILIMIEIGILLHYDEPGIEQARVLLKDTLTLVIGLTAGFFIGKGKDETPKSPPTP